MVNFDSPEDFIARGFGFCLLHGDQIASVATTFAICSKGIEIQINTREEHQRKGLATAVAAHLIVHSLEQGLDPNWDAANESSVGLATKLGYTPQGTYPMLFYTGSRVLTALAKAGLKAKEMIEG
jgi:predicted GNAT family acetyltransferase